jgi:TolB protein
MTVKRKKLKYCLKAKCLLLSRIILIFSIVMIVSCTKTTDYGIFTRSADIGNPKVKGSIVYEHQSGEYRLSGGGENIWGERDEFHFMYNEIEGDFILSARVKFIGNGVNGHRKLGIMVRETLNDNSAHINGVVHGDGLTSMQFRKNIGDQTEEIKMPLTSPGIIQLERKGKQFIFSAAKDGGTFTVIDIAELNLNSKPLVGLFICSHETDVREEAIFDNVRLTFPAKEGFIPYTDYIGSHIELLDIETGKRRIVHSSPLSLQAPNWSPNGKTLVYNSEGKIYAFDIATSSITEINTGIAVNNNNDHVLSFDGQWMGLSDHTEHPEGQSLIYVIPSEGGTPERITAEGPSYLHGFSPDGEFMIYTANRKISEHFDIYRISRYTKEEVRLTNAAALDDGSEYSPDGKYIYFNSSRTGTMQLWRMNADGGNQVQLTFDKLNDWFPHVSPDGKWLVFISYNTDVAADDHPFYKHVYIRLMPAQGGEPKAIAYLYGGQGSMNVFNWSPDGKQIAFVSNSVMQ